MRALSHFLLHYCGFTWGLSLLGMVLAVTGHRREAGLAWLALGAGAVGAAFARATGSQRLSFDNVRPLTEEEISFLVGHLPFLALGLWVLLSEEDTAQPAGLGYDC